MENRLKQQLERLYRRQNFGIKMGLDVEQAILKRLGNPENAYPAIHVAGTNGKGSVCALLDSILQSAGFRTGLYTSPHLIRFNERIKVNGVDVTDEELGALFAKAEPIIADVAKEMRREPTFFECTTAMAFDYFRQKEIQIAVLETGLGGRLDATNVVTPLLSVITPISLEHTKYLGSSIESIASEKCGIIKPERPVVAADMDERAIDVIRQTARARQCRLIEVSGAVNIQSLAVGLEGQKVKVETQEGSYGTFILPLLGQHQLGNLAAAIAAIETLNGLTEMPIDESATRTGITRTNWPGRFHVLSKTPPTILDGAHNPGGAAVLADTLKHIFKEKPIGLILGMCNDKDIKSYLRPLGRLVKRMWAVPLRTDRSLPMGEVAAAGRAMGWEVRESSLKEAQKEAKAWACAADGVVCITGSLFLVGEVLEDGRRPA